MISDKMRCASSASPAISNLLRILSANLKRRKPEKWSASLVSVTDKLAQAVPNKMSARENRYSSLSNAYTTRMKRVPDNIPLMAREIFNGRS